MKTIVATGFFVLVSLGCAPVQEMYLSKGGPTSLQGPALEGAKILSIDTLKTGHETVIKVRYRRRR